MKESGLQSIYLSQISESASRLAAALRYLASFTQTGSSPDLESATLQIRKAMETIAYAVVAPDKKLYASLRAKADQSPDFTRDYHANKIFTALAKVNKDFYPIPLEPPVRRADGSWHFERRSSGFMTRKQFESTYDRLGKHLHAHNPWASGKALENLAKDLPSILESIRALLDRHVRFIQTQTYHGAWVIEMDRMSNEPKLLVADATGPYAIQRS